MDKEIQLINDDQIEVKFTGNTTSKDVKNMFDACADGSCGCDIDPLKDFQSVELDEQSPRIRFTVAPVERDQLIKKMEACLCETPADKANSSVDTPSRCC